MQRIKYDRKMLSFINYQNDQNLLRHGKVKHIEAVSMMTVKILLAIVSHIEVCAQGNSITDSGSAGSVGNARRSLPQKQRVIFMVGGHIENKRGGEMLML